MSDYDNIKNALSYIDPHERDTWFRMGAAIKDELGENGFEMWDNWSRSSNNYKESDAKAVWKSIKTGHIHIATLFKTARENGYRPEQPYTPPSAEELAKRAQEAQAKQRAEAERIAQAHAKAEKTAYGIWKNAQPADPNHAYARNKGLGLTEAAMSAIRQNEYNGKKQLVIPLYSDKKLVNVQTIDEDGNKSFLSGGQKQGAYTIIGDFKQNQNGIVLAEGFATAASVHQATGKPVVVAFDAGNLKAVSEKLIDVLPKDVPVYFAADNDPSHTGEHKAQAAAEVWGERAKIMLPEFTPMQIQQYQEEKGVDKVPTDFNDLHKLAGIEAVREALSEIAKPEIRQPETELSSKPPPATEYVKPELSMVEKMQSNYWRVANGYDPLPETSQSEAQQDFKQPENAEPQEIRTAWNDFPPVISNGKLGDLKNEPEYSAAKAGDVVQSALLVEKLLKDETVQEIKNLIGDSQPILVPIQSEEASGKNMIPRTTAEALAAKLNLQVDENIYQSNTAKRTDTGIYHRYVSPPEFKGEVQAGKSYLIVDDTLSVGGTIATLKGYIENNGGKVIGSTVMTAHELKVNIAIQPNMLQSLQQKQGLNEYWRNEFGYGVDKLTQQEAGHLRKPTLEQIQERVQEARQTLNLSQNKELNHEQTTQSAETKQRPVYATPEIDRPTSSGIETASSRSNEVSQSVFQQSQPPRNEEVSPTSQTATSDKDVAISFSEKENIMENQKTDNELNAQDFSQSENSPPPDYYNYNFEDLPKERPQVAPNQQETQTPEPQQNFRESEVQATTSEKDVAVSTSEADEPEQEMPNTIEYDGFQHEIKKPEPVSEIDEPEQEKSEPERPAPEQEKPNTGLDYEVPEHLKSRMVAVDAQRFRLAGYEMGAHLLRYTAPDNPKTVLFEDKGKSIHTARDDKQTIQDMLDIAKAKGWDSIKISGSQEFRKEMWLEAESRGIATKGYKPSPEDLMMLERKREERATNSIAEAEKLKQQSAVPERPDSTIKTIPQEAVKAADAVKAHATQAQQTNVPKPSDTAKSQYESKLATLPTEQQHKARFYERQALAAMRHMPAEFHEKTRQAIYENQADLIRDGKYHAPDPVKTQDRQPEKAHEPKHERAPSRDDWEMER